MLFAIFAAIILMPAASVSSNANDNTEPLNEWTLMLYCGADNDLELVTEFALEQCEKAMMGEDDAVISIIALVDLKNPDGTWIYEINDTGCQLVDTWVEQNTSDPSVLKEFIEYGLYNYPAHKNILVIKSGHAWCGVCTDETDGNFIMPMHGVAQALSEVKGGNGKGIDVLALDGDNMASIEGAYELRNSIDYFVASQQDMPIDGLPYYLFVSELVENPEMTPERLSERIVYNYVLYYNNTEGKKNSLDHLLSNSQMAVTMSAFEMAKVQAVGDAFGALMDYMIGTEDWIPLNRPNISSARDSALIGKMGDQAGYEWLPDVNQFFIMLEELVNYAYYYEGGVMTDTVLPGLVDDFTAAMEDACVKMEQCQILNRSGNSHPHGLNFWFPPTWIHWEEIDNARPRTYLYDGSNVPLPAEYYCIECPYDYDDCGLDFVDDYAWMDFLAVYYDSRWVINNSGNGNQNPGV